MRSTAWIHSLHTVLPFLVGALITASGCSKENEPPEILSLEGRIEKIKVDSETTGEITVVFFSEKQHQEITGTAAITPETEITIDGAAATLKDLRDGERIKGQVRVEKKGKQKTHAALKIRVDRPKTTTGG